MIILVVSFLMLGVRPGAVVAIAIPVTLAVVFLVMQIAADRPAPRFRLAR